MAPDRHGDVLVSFEHDHVATLELDRPPNNFLDQELVRDLADVMESLEQDATCRVIVLVAAGKHFCAGARLGTSEEDLASIPAGPTNPLYDEVVRLFRGTVPIVAAVQGAAVGAGLGLALVADFRVTCPEARFAASFTRLGFHPGFGITATLPRVVGRQRALELLYTGRRITGTEAHEIGLCDVLVTQADVRDGAHRLAVGIASAAPLAVRAVRRTMRAALAEDVAAATATEHREQRVLRSTEDYREGVNASAERRDPTFVGR